MREILIRVIGIYHKTGDKVYSANIGCETFVFLTREDLMAFIDEYMANPNGFEAAWYREHPPGHVLSSLASEESAIPEGNETIPNTKISEEVERQVVGSSKLGQRVRGGSVYGA